MNAIIGRLSLLSVFALSGAEALAGGGIFDSWQGGAGVRTSLIWSDNLNLTPEGGDGGLVYQLRPFISGSRNGSRLRARFNYGPSFLYYPSATDQNTIRHVLSATANAELIERYLFLDVRAQANDALVNPRARAGFDGIANDQAFAQTASLTITPRVEIPIKGGRVARVSIAPGVGAVFTEGNSANTINNRATRNTRVSIVSGTDFNKTRWRIQWRRDLWDAERDQGTGSLSASVTYALSSRYRITSVLGYDDSTYVARNGRSQGFRWEIRLGWTPKPASRFELGFGQAYYGNFGSFTALHRHKRWALRASYRVSIQNAVTAIQDQVVVPLVDEFGNPILSPITGDVVEASITTPALVDDSYLLQNWTSSVAYDWGRNRAQLRWYVTQRDYSQADSDTFDSQLWLTLTRRLTPRLSGSAGLRYWDHSQSGTGGYDYQQTGVDARLTYALGPRTDIWMRFARQQRDATLQVDEFSENRVSLDFVFRL